jgi:hypothetical protein
MPVPDSLDSPFLLEDSNTITGGVVQNVETHLLQPNQAAYMLNIQPQIDGRRQKRNGVGPIACAGSDPPNGLFALEAPLQSVRVLVGQWGSALYSTPGSSQLTRRASSVSLYNTIYQGVTGRGATNTPTLFLTSCVGVSDNASVPYGSLVALDNSFTFTAVSNTRVRSLAWFQSRLWGFNTCASGFGPDYLLWSNVFDGRNFSNGQNVQIDPDTGDQGVAVVPLRDSTPRMFLFKEKSIYLLELYWSTDGYYPTTANSLDFTKSLLRPITLDTGAVATRACLWTPGTRGADVLFLSREGIRSLNRSLTDSQGGAGLPLSYRIQPIIDRINWQAASRATADYWNGVAYFAVPIDGSVNNNFVIAYDVNRDAFWFLDWQIAGWSKAQLTADRKFFFMGNNAVTETYASTATNGYHIYQTDTGTADPGASPIDFDNQTKAFCFNIDGDPGSGLKYRKRWGWLDLALQAATTSVSLTVQYKVDDDDSWTTLNTISVTPADAFPTLPVQLPFAFSSQKLLHRKFDLSTVVPGFKIQFRLRDNVSFGQFKVQQLSIAAWPYPLNFS